MERIICFGCGEWGDYFVKTYGRHAGIQYFLDNASGAGEKFHGYDKVAPSAETCRGALVVVTNVAHYQAISAQLKSYGLAENQDFISIQEFEKRYPAFRAGLKTIKCWFVDFWPDFDVHTNIFTKVLRQKYNVVLDEEAPEFLFSSFPYGKALRYQCPRILYLGENAAPDFNIYDYAIGFEYMDYGDRYLRWPIYRFYGEFQQAQKKHVGYDMDAFMERMFCCRVVSNPGCEYREKFFEKLSERKHVASGGRCKNNLPGGVCVDDKKDFVSRYKFNLAFENSDTSGYVTEKLVQAWAAGCIPVYWGGGGMIGTEFNRDAFIDCSGFATTEEAADYLCSIENDRTELEKILKAPISLKPFSGDDVLEEFLRKIVEQPEKERIRRLSALSGMARSYVEKFLF